MSIEVLTEPTSKLLVTRVEAQKRLEESIGTDDDLFDTLVSAASEYVASRLGSPLTRTQYREYLPGYGHFELRLSRWPIETPSLVEYDGSSLAQGTDWRVSDAERGVLYFPGGTYFTAVRGDGPGEFVTPFYREHYKVEYFAGWVEAGGTVGAGSVAVPSDIKEACFVWIEEAYEGLSPGVSSFSAAGVALSAKANEMIDRLLTPYRRLIAA